MSIVRYKKVNIHIYFILQNQINLSFFYSITNIVYLHLISFFLFYFIFTNIFFRHILINLGCSIKNVDLDLFKRDLICLILIWIKLINIIRKSFFFLRSQNLNILRAPFINNKTGEHFKINYYQSILSWKKSFDILIYKYFRIIHLYTYEHSTINIIKLLV